MSFDLHDTIAALSSAPGAARRGIIRISGAEAKSCLDQLFDADSPECWQQSKVPRRHLGQFHIRAIDRSIPLAVYLWPASRSYTGEPMAELHAPGSPPLLEAMLAELYAGVVRPARAGEFTLRAFLAGKIDLIQAEAVLGVIDADDQPQLESALKQLAGGISDRISRLRDQLLSLLADLEAGLDFADEDIEFVDNPKLVAALRAAQAQLTQLLNQAVERMRSTGARRVVLAGNANAGKSTLFNALLGRSAALVSPVAGTTRDYLSAEIEWRGMAIELFDTAGCQADATGPLREGIAQRDEQLRRADLILWCNPIDLQVDQSSEFLTASSSDCPILAVRTKSDLQATTPADELYVSGATGLGIEELIDAVVRQLSESASSAGELLGTTSARCRDSLSGACAALERAMEIAEAAAGEELLAIEIRDALDELGKICGAVYTDDILDRIFSKFCIGK